MFLECEPFGKAMRDWRSRAPVERLHLCVNVAPSTEIAAALSNLGQAVRFTHAFDGHYTLRTIGSTRVEQADAILASLAECAKSTRPFVLHLGAPRSERHRLVADVQNPADLLRLEGAIDGALDNTAGPRDPRSEKPPRVCLLVFDGEIPGVVGWELPDSGYAVDTIQLVDTSRGTEEVLARFPLCAREDAKG